LAANVPSTVVSHDTMILCGVGESIPRTGTRFPRHKVQVRLRPSETSESSLTNELSLLSSLSSTNPDFKFTLYHFEHPSRAFLHVLATHRRFVILFILGCEGRGRAGAAAVGVVDKIHQFHMTLARTGKLVTHAIASKRQEMVFYTRTHSATTVVNLF